MRSNPEADSRRGRSCGDRRYDRLSCEREGKRRERRGDHGRARFALVAAALGIDVGSSAVRAAVVDDRGRLHGRARRPLETRMPDPGCVEHDPRAWLRGALAAGRDAVESADRPDIVSVGVGALGPAPILVDARLEPLTPAPLYGLDRRGATERARLAVTPDHALPKLLWWKEREPEIAGRAAWAVDATGYLVSALTGNATMDAITRTAYAHHRVETPVPLPEPIEPLSIAGELRPDAAHALGLKAGTPVPAGTYDTYVDVAGTGAGPGDGCVLLGSTLAVYMVVREPLRVAGLELTPYPGEGTLLGGATATAGTALRWLAELVRGNERELAAAAARLEPGAGGLLALPFLAGERAPVWDADARGAVAGLSLVTSREEIYRALVDALAVAAATIAERLPPSPRWRVSGGGCRNAAWLQATSDALGKPLAVAAHAGEAVGPAVLALRAVGIEPRIRSASTVRPDRACGLRYRELAARYRALYERVRPLVHEPSR